MQSQNWRVFGVIAVATVLLVSFTTLAMAQRVSGEERNAIFAAAPRVPTSVNGVTTFVAPPKGFDPLTATNMELLSYGLPQRPDKAANAKAYEQWERGMLALKIHPSDVRAKPYSSHAMVPAGPPPAAGIEGTVAVGSLNWSGIANTNKLKAWNINTSFDEVDSVFNVPVAKPPFGSTPCSYGPWLESSWNGIGGYLQGESLVQGGSSEYWACSQTPQYNGWVEWWPSYAELVIYCGANPCPVSPGDDFWVITYGAKGIVEQYVYLEDLTQQWGNTFGMTWVKGAGLIGASAEYIVERPCCNGNNFYPLLNYVYDFFDYSFAYNGKGTQFFPGSAAATTAIFTMYADNGSTAISIPTGYGTAGYQGKYSIWFADENCAYSGGCVP
jgi:Peptidase A4 family